MPLVSAIVPVFNRTDVLRNAVDSVLAQSHTDFELVIVDDGSSEDITQSLGEILRRPNVSLVRHDTNCGAAAARNTGVVHATGDYVAFLDSDDRWRPEKLAHQLAFMTREVCRASCTGYALIGEGMTGTERQPPAKSSLDDLLWGCRISPGTTLMAERSLFELTGPHDETLRRLEDWDWLLLAAKVAPIGGLAETLADIHHDRYAHVDDAQLRDAARKMADYVREGRYGALSRGQRRILLSALKYELAAMSYRKGRFGDAMAELATSIAYCPWKRPAHILAALNAVRSDIGRALRARGGAPQ